MCRRSTPLSAARWTDHAASRVARSCRGDFIADDFGCPRRRLPPPPAVVPLRRFCRRDAGRASDAPPAPATSAGAAPRFPPPLERKRRPALPAVLARAPAPRARRASFRASLSTSARAARRRAAESSRRAACRRVFSASNAAPPPSELGASASAAASAPFASSKTVRAVSSFASTPERWATSSSSPPTVRTDRMSFCGSASPGLPRRRRISTTASRLPSSSP